MLADAPFFHTGAATTKVEQGDEAARNKRNNHSVN